MLIPHPRQLSAEHREADWREASGRLALNRSSRHLHHRQVRVRQMIVAGISPPGLRREATADCQAMVFQPGFELVEPLRYLFKDEVRAVGEALGLPESLVWRQPFPGPGLTVRCLGEVTRERVSRLRAADAILIEELSKEGLLRSSSSSTAGRSNATSQAFVVLLPVRSVGVMGDQRTYQEAAAVRAVTTEDFMTADWARLPHDLLARVSNRIVNEVDGINRVVYDITSKPPATIEWE